MFIKPRLTKQDVKKILKKFQRRITPKKCNFWKNLSPKKCKKGEILCG